MKDQAQLTQAQEIQDAIRQILLQDWDPIGVRDAPTAQDEYDGYVGGIYRLLASAASPEAVAKHLGAIETEQMGLEHTQPSAPTLSGGKAVPPERETQTRMRRRPTTRCS